MGHSFGLVPWRGPHIIPTEANISSSILAIILKDQMNLIILHL